MQEYIAEFLVAKALGMEKPFNRDGWTLWDIEYGGKRIEVKETGYYHSWRKDGKTSDVRTFGITKAYSQDGTNTKERQNDIYVFCLNIGKDRESSNPLELKNWEFYIIPTEIINKQCGDNKSIGLGRIKQLAKCLSYEEIKPVIDEIITN